MDPIYLTNPSKPDGVSNPYQRDEHISNFRDGDIFRFSSHFNRTFCAANRGDPDPMQHCVASHLGLPCLPMMSPKRTLGLYGINRFQLIHFF